MFGDDVIFLRPRHTYPDIVESARTFFFPDIACSRLRDSRVREIEKARTPKKKKKKKKKNRRNFLFSPPRPAFRAPFTFASSPLFRALPTLSRPPHYLRAWNGVFRIRFPSTDVSGESSIRICNFLNPLSSVDIFAYAMNPESCGR